MTEPARRPSGYHHGDLRNALETAALELVAERGPHGFTLAEASRRAGVSVGAPFKHYAGKEGLLASLARRGYEEQARLFAAAVASEGDPVEQLAAFAAAYVEFGARQRPLFEITFGTGIDKSAYPELEEAGQRVLDTILPPAAALRPDPAEALALVHAVAATAHGYVAFLHEGVFGPPDLPLERIMDAARDATRVLAQR